MGNFLAIALHLLASRHSPSSSVQSFQSSQILKICREKKDIKGSRKIADFWHIYILPAFTDSESCASTDYAWIFRITFSASYCVSEFCTEFSIAEVSTQVATQVATQFATQVSTQLSITCADTLSWGLQQGSIWNWNWSEVHFRPWMQWSGRRGAFRTSKFSPTTNYFYQTSLLFLILPKLRNAFEPLPDAKGKKEKSLAFCNMY